MVITNWTFKNFSYTRHNYTMFFLDPSALINYTYLIYSQSFKGFFFLRNSYACRHIIYLISLISLPLQCYYALISICPSTLTDYANLTCSQSSRSLLFFTNYAYLIRWLTLLDVADYWWSNIADANLTNVNCVSVKNLS